MIFMRIKFINVPSEDDRLEEVNMNNISIGDL